MQEAKVHLPRACTVAWHGCSQSHRPSWRWQLALWSFILFLESCLLIYFFRFTLENMPINNQKAARLCCCFMPLLCCCCCMGFFEIEMPKSKTQTCRRPIEGCLVTGVGVGVGNEVEVACLSNSNGHEHGHSGRWGCGQYRTPTTVC
jgi:hypothetical protein